MKKDRVGQLRSSPPNEGLREGKTAVFQYYGSAMARETRIRG